MTSSPPLNSIARVTIDKDIVVTFAIAGLWFFVALALMPHVATITPDSSSYLDFGPERTPGYPLFLELVGRRDVLWVQPLLAALALGALGWQTSRLTGNTVIAAILMLSIGANPFLFKYNYAILTESLFVSLSMALIACLMRTAVTRAWHGLALASLVAGIAATVRPVGLFLLAVMIFFLLLELRAKFRTANTIALTAAALLPFAGVIACEHLLLPSRNGEAMLFTNNLFGKAAMIDAPSLDKAESGQAGAGADQGTGAGQGAAEKTLAATFAPVRELIAAAPDYNTKAFLTIIYEHCIEKPAASTNGCMHAAGIRLSQSDMRNAALARLYANPLGYLSLSWLHYRALWTVYTGQHLDTAIQAFLDQHRPIPFEQSVTSYINQSSSDQTAAQLIQTPLEIIGIGTAIIAVAGVLAWLWGGALSPSAVIATTTAFAAHCGLLLTAISAVGVPRYMLALWPFMMTAMCCAAWCLLEARNERRAGLPREPQFPIGRATDFPS